MRKRTAQVLAQAGAHVSGKDPRRLQPGVKRLLRLGKAEGLQLYGVALRVLSHQHEVAGVGDQHEPVATPVAAHLVAIRRQPGVVSGGLDLHDAAFGDLAGARLSLLHLSSRVEAEVRVARALLGKLADAEHLWPERAAYGVQQVGQCRVVRSLSRRAARRPYAAQVVKIGCNGCGKLLCAHPFAQGLITSIPLPSKSSTSLVATAAPRQRAIAAIWQSAWLMGRPAARRAAAITA